MHGGLLASGWAGLLGEDGITGLKPGNTPAAGGCPAGSPAEGSRAPILIVAASFGLPGTMQDHAAGRAQGR
jgi:hypothetical protein